MPLTEKSLRSEGEAKEAGDGAEDIPVHAKDEGYWALKP